MSEVDKSIESAETPKSKIRSKRHEERLPGPARRPTPTSLMLYIFLVFFTFIYGLVIPGEPGLAFDQRLAITIFIRLMLVFLLVNRSPIGWIVAVVYETLQIILVALLIEPPGMPKLWGMLFLHTAALALLLTGATRQHVWRGDERIVQREKPETSSTEVKDQADSSSSSSTSG